jgi:hypothetical protein
MTPARERGQWNGPDPLPSPTFVPNESVRTGAGRRPEGDPASKAGSARGASPEGSGAGAEARTLGPPMATPALPKPSSAKETSRRSPRGRRTLRDMD